MVLVAYFDDVNSVPEISMSQITYEVIILDLFR